MKRVFSSPGLSLPTCFIVGIILFFAIAPYEVFALAGNEVPQKKNPVKNFFQNLFQPGRGSQKGSGSLDKPSVVKPDLIDKRAPLNPRHSELFRKAREAFKKKKYDQAMSLLQHILDEKNDSVVFVQHDKNKNDKNKKISRSQKTNHWLTVKRQSSDLLGQFPEAKLRQYQLQYGASAQQMLNDAIAQQDFKLLSDVSIRYLHTEAGLEALNLLGNKHFDRGEFCLAYQCYSRLENSSFPQVNESDWQFKFAFSAHHAGQKKKAIKLIEQIDDTDQVFDNLDENEEGDSLSLDEKFEKLIASYVVKEPRFQEWWMMYGSPSRTGRVESGKPLLLPRWFHPVTESAPLMKKIRASIEEYLDGTVPVIPTIQAVAVGDKIAFRSLRGVLVLDSQTGNRIWETKTADSPEVLLEKMLGKTSTFGRRQRFKQWDYLEEAENPLVDILLDNGTYGSISSDGKQLFIIENHVVMPDAFSGSRRNVRGGVPTQAAQKLLTNRVISYDLSNGHVRWFVGGVPLSSRFEQKLPGCYFFGAPVRSGNDLLVVGEKNNEIRLYVLNPENGDLKWSTLLAYSTVSIKQDLVRRGWTAQVSIAQGMIVCPTTAGWIAGVNRLTQSVEWIHRYSERDENYDPRNNAIGQDGTVPHREIGYSWLPSAPVISKNFVVYTPSEESDLYCLDLLTGQEVWKHKESENSADSIYLAGVFDDQVLMVKNRGVWAYSLPDGSQKWSSLYQSSDRLPAGIGVAVGEQYYLPMQSGVVKSFSLKNGKSQGNTYLRNEKFPLGNLVMSGGMLLSLSPYGLSCFEQKEAIDEEIRQREEKNPQDVWAILRKAEIYFLQQQDQLAIETLEKLNPKDLSKKDSLRYENVMKSSLVALIQSDPNLYEDETLQLEKMIKSGRDQILYDRLISERLIKLEEFEKAFHVILKLCERDASKYIEIGRYKKTKVLIRNWARVRLEKIWKAMPEDLHAILNVKIEKIANEVIADSALSQEAFLVLFGFHSVSEEVRWRLIRDYTQGGKFVEAETHLKRLLHTKGTVKQVDVYHALAELMLDAQLPEDAGFYWRLMKEQFPESELKNGQTVASYLDEKKLSRELQNVKSPYWGWDQYQWNVSKTGSSYNPVNLLKLTDESSNLPFYQNYVFEIKKTKQQLSVQSTHTGKYSWVTPLKSQARSYGSKFIPNSFVNHQMILIHNGVLHCIAPTNKRVLWTKRLAEGESFDDFGRFSFRSAPVEMNRDTVFKKMNYTSNLIKHNGRLGRVTNEYVCVYGRRKIQLLDLLTGEVIWTKEGISSDVDVFGNEDVLLIIPPDKSKAIVLNAHDGSLLKIDNLKSTIRNNVLINEKGWLQLNNSKSLALFGLAKNTTQVKLIDPVSQETFWSHEFSFNSLFSLTDDETLIVLEPSAEMYELNLTSGKKRRIANGLNRSDIRSYSSIYAIADRENYYMFVNRRSRDSNSLSSHIRALPVNGHIYAINRKTGEVRWQQEIISQHLILQQFNHSPLLLMLARQTRGRAIPQQQMHLVAIDKQSGKKVLDYSSAMPPNFNSIDYKLSKKLIELRGFTERIQIRATRKHDTPAASTP